MKTVAVIGAAAGTTGLLQSCATSDSEQGEVLLFTNGTIYIDAFRKAKSLAVKNGRVIGYNIDTKAIKGKTIDLNGSVVYPGFHDCHNHLIEVAVTLSNPLNLKGCNDSDSIAVKLKELADKTPDGNTILGIGFSLADYDAWSLNDLAKIDKAGGNHPVLIMDNLGHNAIANSIVIKMAGITPSTPVPLAGKIVIQDGQVTGMLKESAMILVGEKVLSLFSDEDIMEGVLKLMQLWASFGYTSISDMMGTAMGRLMRPNIFKKLEALGKLPVRVNYGYTLFNLDEVDGALQYVGTDSEMVRFFGYKLYVDGAFGAGQAWTTWKNLQGNNGTYYVYIDDSYGRQYNLNRIIERIDDLGLNIHYHVQGDRAIDAIINAMDRVLKQKGKLNTVHNFNHLGFPRADQIEKMKGFGKNVVVIMQPALAVIEADSTRYYGERMKDAYPIKKIIDAGISTGISTDFSVSPLSLCPVLVLMKTSMKSETNPLTMSQLITGLTKGSALTTTYTDTGSLDVGNWADMVVFNEDLYDVPVDKLNDSSTVKILSTWVGGKKSFG